MKLDNIIRELASELGVDFFGVADLSPARAEILRHCGEPDAAVGEPVPPPGVSATGETPQARA